MAEKFVPFDPRVHKPIRLSDGSMMTERTASEYVNGESGPIWNIPTVWFDAETGRGQEVSIDRAMELAREYEQRTSRSFPRFNNFEDAVSAAERRSQSGGATQGTLAAPRRSSLMSRKND